MSKLIFKQRCFSPNHPKTAVSNREHIRYIATRTGVVCNDGMSHGLFGKVFDMQTIGDILDLDSFKKNIKEVTDKKTVIYRAIISLNEQDALQKGYDKRKLWEDLLQNNISMIAEKMRIKSENVQYLAAVHMDKGHPHAHLIYWEKNQGVRKAWINPQVSNDIRNELTKHVFAEEFSQLYADKNLARQTVAQSSDELLAEIFSPLINMDKAEYKKLLHELKSTDIDLCAGTLLYSKIPDSCYSQLLSDIYKLSNNVPKSGRLSYKLMPQEVKHSIDEITVKILSSNTDCKREFDKYVSTAMEIAKMHSSNPDAIKAAGERAYIEMKGKIGNKILDAVKQIKVIESDICAKDMREKYQRQAVMKLIQSIFSLLSGSCEQQDARIQLGKSGELSKQAKKELALKLSNSSDWEQ